MKNYIKLMRPKHYLKNLLIFLPIIFSGNFFATNSLSTVFFSFFAFCLAASAIYIINDIKDVEKDRMHHIKKNRPLASGKIPIKNAIIMAIILIILSYTIQILMIDNIVTSIIYVTTYILINLLYSMGLKNLPIIDITIIVIGFLIRVLYGASVIDIEVSNWLLLTIMSVSFYLALGKRRNELKMPNAEKRKVLAYYSLEFLDKNMYLFLALALTFYSLWCNSGTNKYLIWTVPIAIIICLRYNMAIEKDNNDGDPVEVICHDIPLIILLIIMAIALFGFIYVGAR